MMTKIKWYTRPVYVLVALTLVFSFSMMPASPTTVMAAGDAAGTFTAGVTPSVSIDYGPGGEDPQTWMNVSVNVTNGDRNLSELSNLTFKFFYDSDAGNPNKTEVVNMPVSTQDGVYINWTQASGFESIVANATTLGNASWDNGTYTAPSNMSATTGDFWFNVTIGKVARKTIGGDCWQITALVYSTGYGNGYGYDPLGVTMSSYSEVEVAANITVDWGVVSPGLTWSDPESEQSLGTDVTYIVNGNYTENVRSTANWTNATEGNATLDDTGACGSAQEFALKANETTVLPTTNFVNSGTGVIISNQTITGDGTADGGSGNVETDNTLWLKLAAVINTAEYGGTISYMVATA